MRFWFARNAERQQRPRRTHNTDAAMVLHEFRRDINAARKTSIDGDDDWWLPRAELRKLMTRKRIGQLLEAVKINRTESDSDHDRELQKRLPDEFEAMPEKTSILALLVHLDLGTWISSFMSLPGGLPVSRNRLSEPIFQQMGEAHTQAFLQNQYHFVEQDMGIGSLFTKAYDDEVIVPFARVKNHDGQEGAFGFVRAFTYTCPRTRKEGRFVRKQFKPSTDAQRDRTDYLTELRNLTVLSSAHHPNIVQPLAAYVHRGRHNLIFPEAREGSLDDVLNDLRRSVLVDEHGENEEVDYFSKRIPDQEVVSELAFLASAISTMHNLQTDTVRKIGCHRDLKPANILVQGRKLILADFGLSRLRKDEELSDSKQPIISWEYTAPECYDQEVLRGGNAKRSSDIWSLGCIILKILIYREHGRERLKKFDQDKSKEIGSFTFGCFFEQRVGRDKKSLRPAVEDELEELEALGGLSMYFATLSRLLRLMLDTEQESRPTAKDVTAQLQHLAIRLWGQSILDQLVASHKTTGATHVMSELIRFRSWLSAIETQGSKNKSQQALDTADLCLATVDDFEAVAHNLADLYHLVTAQGTLSNRYQVRLQPLRFRIDQLLSALDTRRMAIARERIKAAQLEPDFERNLKEFQKDAASAMGMRAGVGDIGAADKERERMIELKRTKIISKGSSHNEQLLAQYVSFASMVQLSTNVANLFHITIANSLGEHLRAGLAEEASSVQLASTEGSRNVCMRLQQTAQEIKRAAESDSMAVLSCVDPGFYLMRDAHTTGVQNRAGLIYQYPCDAHSANNVTTLEEMYKGHRTLRLKLGQKYHLAHRLASTIYNLHLVKWLHRRISAVNVVLVQGKSNERKDEVNAEDFYVIGFANSRADAPSDDTEGVSADDGRAYYQHPKYRSGAEKFKASFDCYSLGILLIEIGYSKLCLAKCKELHIETWADDGMPSMTLLEELEYIMGSKYRDVIEICLGIDREEQKGRATITQPYLEASMQFETRVVESLRQCCSLDL